MLFQKTKSVPDEQEFIQAYDNYADALFRHCYFRVYDRERAKELVQEVFMKVWDYMREGNFVRNLRAFLYKVANNLIIDEARKKKEESLEELQETGFQPSSLDPPLQDIIEGKEMKELLQALSAEYREVILMRYIDDLSPHEIAEVLGISPDLVSVRINRGIKKVQELLGNIPSR